MTSSRLLASATSALVALAAATPVAAADLAGKLTAGGRGVDSAVVSVYASVPGARKVVTVTNAAGDYRFTNLPNGVHIVIIEKDGRRIYQGATNLPVAADRFDVRL